MTDTDPWAAAVTLVMTVAEQAERDRQSYEAGFRDAARIFFDQGRDVGYGQAYAEMTNARADTRRDALRRALSPTGAELERRRWGGPREHFGRPRPDDHPGGPVQWNKRAERGAA